jgi:hypothetical protein
MNAEQLKAQICNEYNLEDGQVETDEMACGVGYWVRLNSPDGFARWLVTFDNFYHITCSQIYMLTDEVPEVIALLNIAADIMAKLESGELG